MKTLDIVTNRGVPSGGNTIMCILNDRHDTARHEASHAIVHLAFGHPVSLLSIVPDEDSFGRCESYAETDIIGVQEAHGKREAKGLAREMIIAYLAGDVGASNLNTPPRELRDTPDTDSAMRLSSNWGIVPRQGMGFIGDDVHEAFLLRLADEARQIIRRHSREFARLTGALLANGALSEVDISRLWESDTPQASG